MQWWDREYFVQHDDEKSIRNILLKASKAYFHHQFVKKKPKNKFTKFGPKIKFVISLIKLCCESHKEFLTTFENGLFKYYANYLFLANQNRWHNGPTWIEVGNLGLVFFSYPHTVFWNKKRMWLFFVQYFSWHWAPVQTLKWDFIVNAKITLFRFVGGAAVVW